jgi:two-component system sensor histidine kinase YesM
MKIRLRSIQSGLFFTYSFIIIIGVLVLVIPFYLWGSDQLTKRGSEYIENLSITIQQKLDVEIESMDSYSMDVLYSNLVKDKFIKFISSSNVDIPAQPTSLADENTAELRDILIATIGPAWDIQQINIYDFNGRVFGAGFDSRVLDASVQSKSWYPDVMAQGGKKVITLPYSDEGFSTVTEKNLTQKYISLCRIFFDNYNGPQGIVEIRQTYDNLFGNLTDVNSSSEPNEHIYVYDKAGNQIYPDPEGVASTQTPYFRYIQKNTSIPSLQKIINPQTKDTELVQSDYSDYTGWYTVIVASEKQLLAPLYSFTNLIILFAIVLLFMALLLSFFAARNFTVPIAQLHKAIQSMDLLEADQDKPELHGKINELVELNLAFQKMSIKTKKSLDDLLLSQKQEMQARMLALQSQMNPHFLYNTLTTISVMAEENMNGQIVDLCGNVSDLLRYISSDKSPLVTMETELDYTKKYLASMQMRYGSKLTYSIDIDSAMSGIEIPKLIIQPLVENALKYGIMTQPPWKITISGAIEGNRWHLRVEDNGSGFPAEVIETLEAKMEEIRRTNLLPSLELEGMGLLNVYVRLWLSYGNNMIFSIGNSDGTGAAVLIGGTI